MENEDNNDITIEKKDKCPSSELWKVLSCFSVCRADLFPSTPPFLTLCVCSSPFHAYIFCPMLSPDTSISGFEDPCTWCWKDLITRSCSSHICLISKELVFLPLLYAKFFKLSVKVPFYYESTVTGYEVDLFKFSSSLHSCSERLYDAFMLLIRFCFLCL